MKILKKERGFIFSLDATLALLVTLVALVGVAQIGDSSTSYSQYGHPQLKSYSNDALKVLSLNETTRKAIRLANNQQYEKAREILRENLQSVLPKEIQFKMTVGRSDNIWLDNVYPTQNHNQAWESALENSEERAVSAQVTVETVEIVQNLDVLAWTDDPDGDESSFTYAIERPGWEVKTTNDEAEFRDMLENDIYPNWYPDVVFLPDVSTDWSDETVDTLFGYNLTSISQPGGEDIGGGVVAGGETLSYEHNDDFGMRLIFGIDIWGSGGWFGDPIQETTVPSDEKMIITDDEHYITLNFDEDDKVPYENYSQYKYELFDLIDTSTLAEWEIEGEKWPGLIAREAGLSWDVYTLYERAVLFNTRLAQSWADGEGTTKWERLATRAIEWCSREDPEVEPVILYLWRGENVGS